jgi:eukaryotic-like serine/threonine-protein kinase
MTPERWQQVKQVFQSALERPTAERAAFLAQACLSDPNLKNEVAALLSAYEEAGSEQADGALETVVTGMAAQMFAEQRVAPAVGQRIGHYELIRQIGAGGMGEVYLAHDSQLARKVALKLLPAHVIQDRQRLERFKQEARAASALNHPNILTIYEIGEEAGQPFIATEFIEGETLRARLAQAHLPLGQALDIAVQAATGLNAAHEAGIVHRDIKPENLMLRRDGYVKILDFGLAKLIKPQADGQENSIQVKTDEGVVLGTPRYMSPEQARGEKLDGRTDIFSLGAVLYEMLARHAPFEGATLGEVIVAILEREPPPLSNYAEGLPAELDQVMRKALRKAREERYPTAKEFLGDLKAIKRRLEFESEHGQLAQASEKRRIPVAAGARQGVRTAEMEANTTTCAESVFTGIRQHQRTAVLIAGGIIILAGAWYLVARFLSGKEVVLTPPRNASFAQLTDQPGPEYFPSLSPDGKSLVYASHAAGNWDIYFQRVGGKNTVNLTRDSAADDTQPVFSPDGESIAFRSEREGGGLFVMGATGESVKRLSDFGFNPAWSPDGKEIVCAGESVVINPSVRWSANNQVWAVSITTGEKRLVMTEGTQPNWSPNGHRIALCGRLLTGGRRDIWTVPAAGGEPVEVTKDPAMDWNPVWSPDGKYLYFASDRGGSMNLWRVPIEERSERCLANLRLSPLRHLTAGI